MPHIEIVNADGRRKVELTDAPLTVGRSRICQCRVNDKSLSREHMEIRKKPDGYWVKDMGSRNRTFVNGLKVEGEMQLRGGDRITAGRTLILFDPTPEQSASAKPVGAPQPKPAAPAAPATAAPAPAKPLAPGEWAPPAPAKPADKPAGDGTAAMAKLAAESSSSASPESAEAAAAPAWKTWLVVAVVLGGSCIIGLVLWMFFFG
jgi:pSer/pThr/pTyr-binding forkhead associated (FHA) protein